MFLKETVLSHGAFTEHKKPLGHGPTYLKGITLRRAGIAFSCHSPRCVIPGGAFSDPESMVAVRWGWLSDTSYKRSELCMPFLEFTIQSGMWKNTVKHPVTLS